MYKISEDRIMATATSSLLVQPGVEQTVTVVGYEVHVKTTDQKIFITIDGRNASETDFVQLACSESLLRYKSKSKSTYITDYLVNDFSSIQVTNISNNAQDDFITFEESNKGSRSPIISTLTEYDLVWHQPENQPIEIFKLDSQRFDLIQFDLFMVSVVDEFEVFDYKFCITNNESVLEISKKPNQHFLIRNIKTQENLKIPRTYNKFLRK